MKTEHTPGQWSYKKVGIRFFIGMQDYPKEVRTDTNAGYICEIGKGMELNNLTEQDEANARLIAAAPDLLQMVDDLKNCIKRLTEGRDRPISQMSIDTEAQWIAEAHELLLKINPDYK
jgi:hypothetical protein